MVSCRSTLPPWLAKDIRKLIWKRDKARRVAKSSNVQSAWQAFKLLRNANVTAIRRSKRYFIDSLASRTNSSRDFWKAYHSITKTTQTIPPEMSLGGHRSAALAQIAEMFNEFFTSFFTQPTSVFDSVVSQEQTYQAEVSTLQCVICYQLSPDLLANPRRQTPSEGNSHCPHEHLLSCK